MFEKYLVALDPIVELTLLYVNKRWTTNSWIDGTKVLCREQKQKYGVL
jgi:hypothetical protein